MKPLQLLAAMLGMSAMSHSRGAKPPVLTLEKAPDTAGFTPSRHRRNKSSTRSQRQLRRDKRKAHAAGFKNAFAK